MNVLNWNIEIIFRIKKRYSDLFRNEIEINPKDITSTNHDEEYLVNAINLIENNMMKREVNVVFMCEELRTSQSQLYRKLKAITNSSPNEFIRAIKLKKGAKLLSNPDKNISEIGYMLGFKAPSHFSRAYKDYFGLSPKEYRTKLFSYP